MFRLIVGFVAVLCLFSPLAGCGGGDDGEAESTAQTSTPATTPEGQSRPAIPDREEKPDYVEGAFVSPFFDEAGTVSELAVTAGEKFTLYVFAEVPPPFQISAAEFRFDLPDGVTVINHETFGPRVLTMGTHNSDFVMGFECLESERIYLIKFNCIAGDDFAGGDIVMTPGVNASGATYLGFVSCQPETRRLPARGGKATLTKK